MAKSSDPEIGVVMKRREWVEGADIGYWISDIGVGTGSNKTKLNPISKKLLGAYIHLTQNSILIFSFSNYANIHTFIF